MDYKKPEIARDLQIIEIDLRTLLAGGGDMAKVQPVYNQVCGLMGAMQVEHLVGLWQIEDRAFREPAWRRRDYRSAEEVAAYQERPDAKLALYQPDTDRMLLDGRGEVMTFATFEEASAQRDKLNAVLVPVDESEALRERVRGE